ncbi:hypothetical protein C8P68_1102 [Mucilaginibacter yixingensis]|uniref:Uncharacterized protein n=1 Tax=Mucilaginibacter yixingensis TaxID=1295612 RepID=A0A2T5J4X0_9SPHI|nr:hypothetical protein [Mucilaginibacter yixingensis]PTQ92871.1 hypothetical protein C8P68_1102 [Mucilaginibacter yixingensis]
MREVLVQILHIFIIVVIIGFGAALLYAMAGGADHWNSRINKRSHKRSVKKGSV